MPGVCKLCEDNVLLRCAEARNVGAARSNLDIIVSRSAKNADRTFGYICVPDKSRNTGWIQRNVCGGLNRTGAPLPLEAFHARIKGDHSATGKTHDGDPSRVDTRML